MNELMNIWIASKTALHDSFANFATRAGQHVPNLVAMIVVIVLGYVVARLLAKLATVISAKLGLQVAAERSGLAESMQHTGIKRNVPELVGTVIFWVLMCLFVMAAFNILKLPSLEAATASIVAWIPKVLVATVLVVVGLLVASFVRGVVATSADRLGVSYAQRLANGCYYVLVVTTFLAALGQLGLEFHLLDNVVMIACGGLALGFGLSFGLGGRDVMAGILAGYYLRQRLTAGDHVEVGNMAGTVREVGPVATIIETEEAGLVNRHTVPNTKMLNEAVR
jgi:small-conductance mechanosensitive channel